MGDFPQGMMPWGRGRRSEGKKDSIESIDSIDSIEQWGWGKAGVWAVAVEWSFFA